MKKNIQKIMVLVLGLVVLSIGGGLAIWFLSYESSITGFAVSSEVPLTFSSDFGFENVNTTDSGFEKTENIILKNADGNVNMTIDIISNVTDVDDECTDYQNDSSVVVEYDGVEINDGDLITVGSGWTSVNVTTTVKRFACPQDIETSITLTPTA